MSQVLVSQLIDQEILIDDRIRQTYVVLGHPGLLVRCSGRVVAGGDFETEAQFFETADGRRFERTDDALRAWEALQAPTFEIDVPAPTVSAAADDVQARRFVARSVIPPRLGALDDAGVRYERLTGDLYLVDGRFHYYPATGLWRSLTSPAFGYAVGGLIKECASPATADETRGGAGDDCSVGKRGVWPPQGGASSNRDRTPGSPGVTGGERPTPTSALLPRVSP